LINIKYFLAQKYYKYTEKRKVPHCGNISKILSKNRRNRDNVGTHLAEIQSGGVKLILWTQTSPRGEMLRTCKCVNLFIIANQYTDHNQNRHQYFWTKMGMWHNAKYGHLRWSMIAHLGIMTLHHVKGISVTQYFCEEEIRSIITQYVIWTLMYCSL
jgi:hypothetical protein